MTMMTVTNKISDIAVALQQKLLDNADSLGLQAVFYGDQERIPTTPVACVEPGNKAQVFKAAQWLFEGMIVVYILVYSSFVQSPQQNRLDSDKISEAIEDLIHQDFQLGGLVVEGHVTEVTSGYVNKKGTIVRASRITYEARGRQQISPPS